MFNRRTNNKSESDSGTGVLCWPHETFGIQGDCKVPVNSPYAACTRSKSGLKYYIYVIYKRIQI